MTDTPVRPLGRVLFVDDEALVLDALVDGLRRQPFEVVTARSAADALSVLSEQPIDVVVTDERMPGMAGSELVAVVRRLFPDTVRIVLTGQSTIDAAIRAINDGEIYRFLTKPIAAAQLAMTIRDALTLRALSRQTAALLASARQQRELLEQLEQERPGVTLLDRTPDGRIQLDPDDEFDLGVLLGAVELELTGATGDGAPRA